MVSEKTLGGNPLRWMNKEEDHTPDYIEFWRKLSDDIRNNHELYIEPTPSLDVVCQNCQETTLRYNLSCQRPDNDYRNGIKLFHDMGLKYGVEYPAQEVAKRMRRWAKEHPYLPIQE